MPTRKSQSDMTQSLTRFQVPELAKLQEPDALELAIEGDNAGSEDAVIRLSEWGTTRVLPLRVPAELSHPEESQGLRRNQRYVTMATQEVELSCDGQVWRFRDRAGRASFRQDGAPASEATLLPGMEIEIDGKTLIAETSRTIRLRAFLSRLLGWGEGRIPVVDQALRSLRLASAGRVALLLCGAGDLVQVARALHRYADGRRGRFVVSDPRRNDVHETVRSPANCQLGLKALRKAANGSLCVHAARLPPDFDEVLQVFRGGSSSVRLVVCAGRSTRTSFALGAARVEIPPLTSRADDLLRIVQECAHDVITQIGLPRERLTSRDLVWVADARARDLSIPEIEKALLRVAIIKTSSSLAAAARRLGMVPISLARWLDRRVMRLPNGERYVPCPTRPDASPTDPDHSGQ